VVTRTYRVRWLTRRVNAVFTWLAGRGRGKRYLHVLTVAGRRTGQPRSTPVDVMDVAGQRFLVAPYGEVNWVRNVRAAGSVRLSRAGDDTSWRAEEVHGLAAVPVLRQYIRTVPVTRAYWEVAADAPDEELAAVVDRHPVFRLHAVPAAG